MSGVWTVTLPDNVGLQTTTKTLFYSTSDCIIAFIPITMSVCSFSLSAPPLFFMGFLPLVLSRLHLETIVNLTYTPAHLAEVKKNKVCGKKDFFFTQNLRHVAVFCQWHLKSNSSTWPLACTTSACFACCDTITHHRRRAQSLLLWRSFWAFCEHQNSAAAFYTSAKMQKCTTWRHVEAFTRFPITPYWCDVQRCDAEVTSVWPQTSSISG